MRIALLALMAIGTLSAIDVTPVEARPSGYPFCMRTRQGDDDCSYSTYRQCFLTASGQGTTCFQNPALAYEPPTFIDEPAPRRPSRPRRDY